MHETFTNKRFVIVNISSFKKMTKSQHLRIFVLPKCFLQHKKINLYNSGSFRSPNILFVRYLSGEPVKVEGLWLASVSSYSLGLGWFDEPGKTLTMIASGTQTICTYMTGLKIKHNCSWQLLSSLLDTIKDNMPCNLYLKEVALLVWKKTPYL